MRLREILMTALAAGSFVVATACASQEGGEAREDGAPESEVGASEAPMPAADAAALWAHLHEADYTSWALWPGKGEKYEGTEPHGMLLTTRLNDVAAAALTGGASRMPNGAIIVKENYMPDGQLAAITTMYKVDGFNPEANDWHWTKFLPDGSVDMDGMAQGKVPTCIGCHSGRADNDYIYTGDLGGN